VVRHLIIADTAAEVDALYAPDVQRAEIVVIREQLTEEENYLIDDGIDLIVAHSGVL
jgi:hypothetical protein